MIEKAMSSSKYNRYDINITIPGILDNMLCKVIKLKCGTTAINGFTLLCNVSFLNNKVLLMIPNGSYNKINLN